MYRSHSDSEVIFALLPHMPGDTILERITHLVRELEGAFSLIFLSEEGLTAVRDPDGFRPLVMGSDKDKGNFMFASEVNAFDMMEGHFEREIKPGEIVHIRPNGEILEDSIPTKRQHLSQCVFEHIYFIDLIISSLVSLVIALKVVWDNKQQKNLRVSWKPMLWFLFLIQRPLRAWALPMNLGSLWRWVF